MIDEILLEKIAKIVRLAKLRRNSIYRGDDEEAEEFILPHNDSSAGNAGRETERDNYCEKRTARGHPGSRRRDPRLQQQTLWKRMFISSMVPVPPIKHPGLSSRTLRRKSRRFSLDDSTTVARKGSPAGRTSSTLRQRRWSSGHSCRSRASRSVRRFGIAGDAASVESHVSESLTFSLSLDDDDDDDDDSSVKHRWSSRSHVFV